MIVNNFSESKKFVPLYIKIVNRYDHTCFEAVYRYDSFRKTGFEDAISFFVMHTLSDWSCTPIRVFASEINDPSFCYYFCKAKGKNRLRQIFGEIDRF